MKRILFITSLIVMLFALSSCIVAGGAAVGAGGTAIYDQRSLKVIATDNDIDENLYLKLAKSKEITEGSHLNFTTYRGKLLLAGQTKNEKIRGKVIAIAKKISGVQRIYNHIVIDKPSDIVVRSQDTWITTKVKTKFLGASGLKSGEFKVLTEGGTVYLMGYATHAQTDLAVTVVKSVVGVQKVVNLVDYEK